MVPQRPRARREARGEERRPARWGRQVPGVHPFRWARPSKACTPTPRPWGCWQLSVLRGKLGSPNVAHGQPAAGLQGGSAGPQHVDAGHASSCPTTVSADGPWGRPPTAVPACPAHRWATQWRRVAQPQKPEGGDPPSAGQAQGGEGWCAEAGGVSGRLGGLEVLGRLGAPLS